MKTRMWRKIALAGIGLIVIMLVLLYFAYRSTSQGPTFYSEALKVEVTESRRLGNELEDSMLNLHNTAVRNDDWSFAFSDEQVNGWLATQLPRKFPSKLPKSIKNPRVQILEDRIRIAFQLDVEQFNGVVSIDFEVFVLADKKNLGLKIIDSRSGWVPLPKKRIVEELSNGADRADIPIAWTDENGDPVALLPPNFNLVDSAKREVAIESIELKEGEMILAGTAADVE